MGTTLAPETSLAAAAGPQVQGCIHCHCLGELGCPVLASAPDSTAAREPGEGAHAGRGLQSVGLGPQVPPWARREKGGTSVVVYP